MKYIVEGQMNVDFRLEVEAESEHDAKEDVELICFLDINEDGIIGLDITTNGVSVDNVESLSQDVWDNMSKVDKISKMIEDGFSEDAAYELAGRDEVPEEVAPLLS